LDADGNQGDSIPYGSTYEPFNNVLSFFNWYRIPLMKDFGIIIIDDQNKGKYGSINIECFNNAKMLGGSAIVIFLGL